MPRAPFRDRGAVRGDRYVRHAVRHAACGRAVGDPGLGAREAGEFGAAAGEGCEGQGVEEGGGCGVEVRVRGEHQ